jgi:hypothetical protein
VTIEGRGKVVETNYLGRFDIPQLAKGTYNISFSCKGYKDVFIKKFEVKSGVYNTLNVELEAVVALVLVAV